MKRKFKRRKTIHNHGPNAAWVLLFLLLGFLFYLFWYNQEGRHVEQLNFSTFLNHVEAGSVEAIEVRDQHVKGLMKNGQNFESNVVPNEHFWQVLRQHKVGFLVYPQEKQSWGGFMFLMLFMMFLSLLGFLYMRQSQGGGGAGKIFSIGKSKARFFLPNSINVTFGDVAGVPEAKEDLTDIIDFLNTPEKFERLGA